MTTYFPFGHIIAILTQEAKSVPAAHPFFGEWNISPDTPVAPADPQPTPMNEIYY